MSSSRPWLLSRLALVMVTIVAVLATSTGVASAAGLDALTQVASANDDMGSTAIEWSGATYNADSHVLVTVDDEDTAYEFQLNPDGSINSGAEVRIIVLDINATDFEGVAWIGGETYGFLSEDAATVFVAAVPAAAADGSTTVGLDDIERSFSVGLANTNIGPEGLATDGAAFYVTKEMPATLSKYDIDGNFEVSVDLSSDLADATGVAVLPDGTFLVASHESRLVAHYDVNWSSGVVTEIAILNQDGFTQLEGIAVIGSTDVHLFGEDNTRKGNPGQTYAHLVGDLGQPAFAAGDIDCSGALDVFDAITIMQMQVSLATANPACGDGDHNGDGIVDMVDAVLVAQCSVSLYNDGCPDPSLA